VIGDVQRTTSTLATMTGCASRLGRLTSLSALRDWGIQNGPHLALWTEAGRPLPKDKCLLQARISVGARTHP
jgi:hypothetical protein